MSGYDTLLGLRESEDSIAETFEADFPTITGRGVKIIGGGLSPDREAIIDGIETGLELTAIHAGDAHAVLSEIERISHKKGISYQRRGLFVRPIILLGALDWPARDTEGEALFDFHDELATLADASIFDSCGFSEIWLMDASPKYSSRRDPRAPADFFCFAPARDFGFYQRERKRRPYWSLAQDRFL